MLLLSPLQLKVASNSVLIKLFDKLIGILINAEWTASMYTGRAQTEYADMIKNKKFIDIVHEFDIIEDWLNDFYMKFLNQSYIHLCEVVKLCLILSHGNARVESSFSINSDIIEKSLKKSSLVSQRMVYEGIMKKGGIMKADIPNEMIDYVGRSYRLYR